MRVTIEIDDMLIIVQKYGPFEPRVTFVPPVNKPVTMSIDSAMETIEMAREIKSRAKQSEGE